MNTYEHRVVARCPVDPAVFDVYDFVIQSPDIIHAEDILRFFKEHAGDRTIFQEDLTMKCASALQARVVSVGWHSGIKATCEAP